MTQHAEEKGGNNLYCRKRTTGVSAACSGRHADNMTAQSLGYCCKVLATEPTVTQTRIHLGRSDSTRGRRITRCSSWLISRCQNYLAGKLYINRQFRGNDSYYRRPKMAPLLPMAKPLK